MVMIIEHPLSILYNSNLSIIQPIKLLIAWAVHYCKYSDPSMENPYQQVIKVVSNTLAPFATDNGIPGLPHPYSQNVYSPKIDSLEILIGIIHRKY